MTLSDIFKRNLRQVMAMQNIDANALSRKCGMYYKQVGRLLTDDISPTLRTVARICKALGVDPSAMMEE